VTRLPLRHGVLLIAAGGALGAVLRWVLSDAWRTSSGGFPWTVFGINVAGSALLALLPAVPAVRRSPGLALFLGTGLLGGFTTMSTASTETAQLLQDDHAAIALAYAAGTLLCAVWAALLVDRLSTPEDRLAFEDEEGDE
jgi:CrcB protein